jgi:hypothetical protein
VIGILGWLCVGLASAAVQAAEVEELEVSYANGSFYVTMIFSVAAEAARVRAVLTDYARLTRLHPTIIESGVLPAPRAGVTRVRTRTYDCILIFCADITRVEDVSDDGAGGFRAVIVPALSDMSSGHSRWCFDARGKTTRVTFKAQMDPDFWVPPLIGPAIIKHGLRRQLAKAAANLERLAESR